MTLSSFIAAARKAKVNVNPDLGLDLSKVFVYPASRSNKPVNAPDFIAQTWDAHGYSGGSYTGSEAEAYVGESAPTQFPDLIKLLNEVCPQITFIQYQMLEASGVVQTGEETHSEYYGNSTTYGYRVVILRDLYAKLVELGAIEETP